METKPKGRLDLDTLSAEVDAGRIDTVLIAMTDMQGRLQGKRLTATHFLDEVVEHDAEGCNYLLAVDVEMNTVEGYTMSSWDKGYGDFVFKPDMETLRLVPWQEGTAMVTCDLVWENGSPVVASPRQILKRQLERLAERGLEAFVGTELEFIVFKDSYEDAWRKGYKDLDPANLYNVDYSLLGTARIEPLLRRIRNTMAAAGLAVEDAKGECNFGQHEINFKFDKALATADGHAIYKNGAKEIAAQEDCSITFMPKFDEREGNSCHVHLSLRSEDGTPVFADGDGASQGFSETFERFLAGQVACLREFMPLFAPNINSYKRYAKGSFAPTAVAWGRDNRTCSLRVVGHGPSLRVENRIPGGDVNPYLAVSAMIAAGLHGLDNELSLEDEFAGNAYETDKPHVPTSLKEARELFAASDVAREAFGDEVVEHYLNAARVEIEAHEAAVTDWERRRTFERL
ncbi:MAG: glutamine synthetase family protein [Actinomycetota bacterium]|nr:glutamine synthetase family protein [Actinomycetota bacterium]MDQ3429842.1 glutamine synthetase family protein [Actinomycetota bacterium]